MTVPSILYEDDVLVFVDKPPGIVVQRGYDPVEPTLLDWVRDYLAPSGSVPSLLQRLDRGTSGVIFFPKDPSVNPALTRQFERRQIHKTYLALCEGELAQVQTIDAPLARIGPISFGVGAHGKRAVTRVRPVATAPGGSLLVVQLMTGRTHQIRAHLAAIGHALAGDWLYGERNASRPMLHAWRLSLRHPRTGEELTVSSPLPEDFREEAEKRGVAIPEDLWEV